MTSPRARYRVTDDLAFVHSSPYPRGVEFDYDGWPPAGTEPINEPAKKIAAHAAKHFPPPRARYLDPPHRLPDGRYFLPAQSARPYREWTGRLVNAPALPKDITPATPLYTVMRDLDLRGQTFDAGTAISWTAWPIDLEMLPANEAAEAIAEYFARHKDDPGLPPSPWNSFDESLYLPDEPATKPSRAAADEARILSATAQPGDYRVTNTHWREAR